MTISNWLTLASIVTSLLIATVSVVQTQKIQEQANRPYLIFYVEAIDSAILNKYLSIKNFGKSACVITKLTIKGLEDDAESKRLVQLPTLQHSIFAPGQKVTNALTPEFVKSIDINVEYRSISGKKYYDSFHLKTDTFNKLLRTYQSANKSEDKIPVAINNLAAAVIKSK